MPIDLELSMVTMFRDATMQSVIPELRTDVDWERFNTIAGDAKQLTKDEVDGFERERPKRLADARKDIIDDAGALKLEYPAPFGTDKFDKAVIERQAIAKIFNDHLSTLLGIKSDEADAYVALGDEIRARENTRGLARESFNQSTDRRIGVERRGPTRSQ